MDAVAAVAVRVGVLLGDAAVGGPAGVGDAGRRRRRGHRDAAAVLGLLGDRGAQVVEVADRAHAVDLAVVDDRDPGRVIAAVLELLESGDQQVEAGAPADVSDDSAHREAMKGRGRRARRALGGPELTSRSQTASASSALGASTITRTSGSVPEGRRSTRPRPSSASSSRSTASQTGFAPAIASRSATSTLTRVCGSFSHRRDLGEVAAAELAHRRQRRGDAVAGGDEAGVDDVARLLAAERPAALAQLVEHVAVADLGHRDLDPGLLHRLVEAVVAHHGDGDAAAELAAARHPARRQGDQLVAVVRAAGAVDGEHAVAVAVEGEADRRLGAGDRRGEAVEVGGAAAVVDVAPVGLGADRLDRGAEPLEDRRRGAEGGAVGAVEHHVLAGEVEGEGGLQRPQVVLEAAVQLAHAARARRRRARHRAAPRSAPRPRRRAWCPAPEKNLIPLSR